MMWDEGGGVAVRYYLLWNGDFAYFVGVAKCAGELMRTGRDS